MDSKKIEMLSSNIRTAKMIENCIFIKLLEFPPLPIPFCHEELFAPWKEGIYEHPSFKFKKCNRNRLKVLLITINGTLFNRRKTFPKLSSFHTYLRYGKISKLFLNSSNPST